MNVIDLSVPLEHEHPSEPIKPQVAYQDHDASAPVVAAIFGAEVGDLPEGKGWAVETVTASTHAGTHVDAPYHYFPTCAGEPARTIDQLLLEWFVRPGVRLDLRAMEQGARIEVADVEAALVATGHELQPYDIVLLWTGAGEAWGRPDYPVCGSGLGGAATEWLIERGVKVIGTDAWGLDRPFDAMRAEYLETRDASRIWEAHRVGIRHEYCQIEKLHNLGALPAASGFTVSCLPVKLTAASGSWCRAVAVVD